MTDAIGEMKLAADLVQHEDFMGRCEAGFPLLAFVEHCHFCGATYAERCRRLDSMPRDRISPTVHRGTEA